MRKTRNSRQVRHAIRNDGCGGFTLVEVTIAMALTVLMCAGLYTMGLQSRRSSLRNRLATEARTFAKERLEEIVAIGGEDLAKPSNTLLDADQVTSPTHYVITRNPRVVWHATDRSVVADASDAAYGEVHVDVSYRSPHTSRILTDTYSMLLVN